ncbi:MAG: acyl carrier protein [Bacteroidota bacterium]|nr:acyl carrier protein [Bacteroidota bacterium]
MEREKVEAKVKKTIADVLKKDVNEIASDANFIFDLGADSMQSLQLVAGFEEEFDIEMDEDDALEIQSVKDAVVFIEKIVNG